MSRITFETANLAKGKGFKEMPFYIKSNTEYVSGFSYDAEDEEDTVKEKEFQFEDNICSHLYLSPTQAELQKWLREIHNIDILPFISISNGKYYMVNISESQENKRPYQYILSDGKYVKT
jgi:hypothetical protein